MKKIIIAVLFGVFSAMPSFAQFMSNRASFGFDEMYYGFRIGPSISGITGSAFDFGSPRVGLSVGAVVGFPLSDVTPLFIESGVTYVGKGGNDKENGLDIRSRMDYLELPIVFKYSFEVQENFAIQPMFGGYFSYGIGGETKDYKTHATPVATFSGQFFNRFDAGFKFGVGAQYDLFYAELVYDLGLVNISHETYSTAHNSAFLINFGVNF